MRCNYNRVTLPSKVFMTKLKSNHTLYISISDNENMNELDVWRNRFEKKNNIV